MMNRIFLKLKELLILLLIIGCLNSCSRRDKTKFKITDFSKKITTTIEPYESCSYTMMNVWVKGHTNGTILLKLGSDENSPILVLSGDINERWYTDYYGEGARTLIFDPYKATEGNLEIKFQL